MSWLNHLWQFAKPKPARLWDMRIVRYGICTVEGCAEVAILQMSRGDQIRAVPLTRWGKYLAGSGIN